MFSYIVWALVWVCTNHSGFSCIQGSSVRSVPWTCFLMMSWLVDKFTAADRNGGKKKTHQWASGNRTRTPRRHRGARNVQRRVRLLPAINILATVSGAPSSAPPQPINSVGGGREAQIQASLLRMQRLRSAITAPSLPLHTPALSCCTQVASPPPSALVSDWFD